MTRPVFAAPWRGPVWRGSLWKSAGTGEAPAGPSRVWSPSDIPQAEADALVAFYDATNGDSWTSPWGFGATAGAEAGLTVSGGHVTMLNITDNNLAGNVGSTLAPLGGSLTYLRINNNPITGIDISTLTALEYLFIQNCLLPELNVSHNTALLSLSCEGNSIPSMNVALSAALASFFCFDNGMEALAVDTILVALDENGVTDGSLRIGGTNASPTDGSVTGKDGLGAVSNLLAKSWTVDAD